MENTVDCRDREGEVKEDIGGINSNEILKIKLKAKIVIQNNKK